MRIKVTRKAVEDLSELPIEVEETFYSKKKAAEKNLDIGAEPDQVFNKHLSGNMHPVLQMNLGRDYRAWFIEGSDLEGLEDDSSYCLKVLEKQKAKKLTGKIRNALEYFSRVL